MESYDMRLLGGIVIVFLACSAFASEKMTSATVEGTSYSNIQDVHVTTGGRVVIIYSGGGVAVAPDKLPKGFLASWGISTDDLAESKAAEDHLSQQLLNQSIQAGYFREVEGVVYDLRKSQPAWRRFTDARIIQVIAGGALVDPAPNQGVPSAIFVRNLPRSFADNDKLSFMAKTTGNFSYMNKLGVEHTVHGYDLGRICQRNEIPDVVLRGEVASARISEPEHAGERTRPEVMLPDSDGLRAIGSGFFITKDGYLITNFHVVKNASKLKVKHGSQYYKAEVIDVDKENDLALVKVAGESFSPLAFSRKESAELGDEVFTIGFPNINLQGVEPKYTDGKISSLTGIRDDPSEYQISVPVQPGNSGGPLCNPNGEVVGIVVARLNDMAALRTSGAVPQNVNYAIKAKLAQTLLKKAKGYAAAGQVGSDSKVNPVQTVENAIAMVLIY